MGNAAMKIVEIRRNIAERLVALNIRHAALLDSARQTQKTLGLAWRSSPPSLAGIALLTLASALLPLGIAYAGKLIIDAVVARSVELATQYVLLELGLVALQAVVQRTLSLLRSLLGARLGLDVNVAILDKALQLALPQFENPEFYDRLTRARREASSRPLAMVTESLQFLQNTLTLLGYIGLLVSYSGWMVAALVLATLPATLVEMRFSRSAFRLRNWRSPDTRKLYYVEYVLANDEHVKEVKLLGLGPLLLKRYREFGEQFYREDRSLSARRALWAGLLSLLATAAFYGGYLSLAFDAATDRLSLGDLTLYVVAFRQGQQAFQSCLSAIGSLYEDNLYMSNLFAFLEIETPPAIARPGATGASDPEIPGPEISGDGIRFEDVGFRYPGRDEWALRHITLAIPPKQSLALVGHNGAGKSTLIKLLCGFYRPAEGRILLDGRDLRAWDEAALRRRISAVFQDFSQYQFSLRENVGFGDLPHLAEDAQVRRAVERGGAEPVVEELPQGLDTQLGRWFKDGVELSGGQWQKIALARTFMREDADILILDEPTAALDAEAEKAVFDRFRTLARDRTSLLISHRFPTVRMADRIVVIEHGQIIEQGSHDALVQAGGRYAQLFRLQAEGYL
jgi:ATP-binding cassette, subfamily B, bacterial